jgi:protein SCO1/2
VRLTTPPPALAEIFRKTDTAEIERRAGDQIRTGDLLITSQLLYQLSYASAISQFCKGIVHQFEVRTEQVNIIIFPKESIRFSSVCMRFANEILFMLQKPMSRSVSNSFSFFLYLLMCTSHRNPNWFQQISPRDMRLPGKVSRSGAISLFALFLMSGSCSKQEQKQIDLVTFPLKGEIVEIDTSRRKIVVSHEEILDYMMAMTMPFKVKNLDLLKGLHVGDSINAVLAVSRTESWLEAITVVGKGEVPDPQLVEGAIMTRVLKIGDMLPNEALTNQDGTRIHFSDFKGKIVGITFIYTRCPLPDYCILMSTHFAKLQKLLGKEPSLRDKWHLITISFDPKFDSPKVLKEYGKSYNADFSSWDFVTDSDTTGRTIMKLADALGLTYENDNGGLIAHNLRTVLLDKSGRVAKIFNGNEWTPGEIAAEIKRISD